ncbi:MAG: CHRD domain-containing protein [Pseudomonadota bacterium]
MPQFFTVDLPLSETQEAGPNVPVDTAATGSASIAYDPTTGLMTVEGSFENLSGPLFEVGGADSTGFEQTAVHIHLAGVGRNGPIAFNLGVTDNGDGSGTFQRTFEVTPEQAEVFAAGGYYINLHTTANPTGELRGQLDVDSGQFDIVDASNLLSEDQEVIDTPIPDGPATGNTEVFFDSLTNTLVVTGTFSGLSADLLPVGGDDAFGNTESAIHLHNGLAGQNGPIVRNLTVTDNGDGSGSFEGRFVLSEEEVADLRADAIYVNLHTTANPTGEIRGQLALEQDVVDTVTRGIEMSEAQEVVDTPIPDGPATGSIDAFLDAQAMEIEVSGTFSGLSSPLFPVGGEDAAGNPESAVHIHFAPAGQNGPIFRNLTVTDNGDGTGSFTGRFAVTEEEARAFAADQYYVNLHTEANPTGELRGQIDLDSGRFDDVTRDIPIEEAQEVTEVPVVDTASTGRFDVTFDSATNLLTVDGTFENLTSPLNPVGGEDGFGNPESAVHVHFAPAGQNGPILFNLAVTDNGDGSGSFSGSIVVTDEQRAEFDAGNYYVNLHTEANPSGELRGQLFLSSDIDDDTVLREEIAGTLGDDAEIAGTSGNDAIRALTGDDGILASAGNDLVDGGDGLDTLILGDVASTDIDVAIDPAGESAIEAPDGEITAVNLEVLALSDGDLRLDVGQGETAGAVARLYTGVLGREGDAAGLDFWIGQVDNGLSLEGLAAAFANSDEFAAQGGADSDAAFLDALYQNLRGGPGDAEGLAFWTEQLQTQNRRVEIVLAFAESDEAVANNADLLDEGVFLG